MRFWKYFAITTLLIVIGCSGADTKNQTSKTAESTNHTAGDTLNFQGILIDTHCYELNQQNIGDNHTLPQSGFREDCAAYCANLGYPVGVLVGGEPGNKVWIMRFSSQIFADFMAETVRVEGRFVSGGLVEPIKIEMKTENGWIQII